VHDSILPEDNVTGSLDSAWNESNSHGSDLQINTLFVAPPVVQNIVNVDVAISVVTMNVSISMEGNNLTTVLASDLIPRNVFTAHLSRSILSVVAAFGPWSSGYGLPPLEFQMAAQRTILQVTDHQTTHLVCFSARILNPEPIPCVIQISELKPDGDASALLPMMPTNVPALGNTQVASIDGSSISSADMLSLVPTANLNEGPQVAQSDPMIVGSDLGLAQVLSGEPGPSTALTRRSKQKAPLVTIEVRRSTMSTSFDGFRVLQITDTRATTSKVKPTMAPSAASSSSSASMDQAPPPTPISVMQEIGINRCVVPPQELTKDALLALGTTAVIPNSLEDGS